ncbi:MAG: methylated-DNA--[protein]-cysteine S-methyltransferase [Gemmatimonadaceae bacterium]
MPLDVATASSTMMTPIGELLISACAEGLSSIRFEGTWTRLMSPIESTDESADERAIAILRLALAELGAYFDGTLHSFSVPCFLQGTSFQKSVWTALQNIPYGQVTSYQGIADRVRNRKAVRAVGAANGQNPVPIVIPCHRVIGSDGSLTGFGGGIERKQWLLEHEGALPRCLV